MTSSMTVPISIGTAIAIQAICGYDPEGKLLGQGPVVQNYRNIYINVRTLARNFIGGQLQEVRSSLNERDIVYGIVSDLKIINEVLQKFTPSGIKVVPYLCLHKNIKRIFPGAILKEPKTEIQRSQKRIEDNVIDLLVKTQALNKTNHILIFDTKFNIPKQDDTLIITHQPIDLLNDTLFRKLVLLESHTGKLKTSIEWNTKLKNFKPEYQRIPFNELTIQMFGDTGDLFFPILSPKLKNELVSVADKFQWNPLTTKQRLISGISIINNKELLEVVKNINVNF